MPEIPINPDASTESGGTPRSIVEQGGSAISGVISFTLYEGREFSFDYRPGIKRKHSLPGDDTLIDKEHANSPEGNEIKGGGMGILFPISAKEDGGVHSHFEQGNEVPLVAKVPKAWGGFSSDEIRELFGLDESWTEEQIRKKIAAFSWHGLGAPIVWLANLADMCARQNKSEGLVGGVQLDPHELAQHATTGKAKNKYRLDQLGHLLNEAYILNILRTRYCETNPGFYGLRFFEVFSDDGEVTFMPFIVMERLSASSRPIAEYFSKLIETITGNSLKDEVLLDEQSRPYITAAVSLESLAKGLVDIAGSINIGGNYKPLVINGDLKPAHLLVEPPNIGNDSYTNQAGTQIRIVDFGLGKVLLNRSGDDVYDSPWSSSAKTPAYSPLEKLLGDHNYPEKHDAYAIAKIVCELLSEGNPEVFDYQEVIYVHPEEADTVDAYNTPPIIHGNADRTRKVAIRVNEDFQKSLMEIWRLQEGEAKTVMSFVNKYLQPLPDKRGSNPAVLPLLVSELISAILESSSVSGKPKYDIATVLDLMKLNTGGAEVDKIYERLGQNNSASAAGKTIARIVGVLVSSESSARNELALRIKSLLDFLYTEGKNSGDIPFGAGINPITVVGEPPDFDMTSLDTSAPYQPRPQINHFEETEDTQPGNNGETEL